MMASLIDGKTIALGIQQHVEQKIAAYRSKGLRSPFLAVILVGENPASELYVSVKQRACQTVGIGSKLVRLSASASQADLHASIQRLNQDPGVDGILLQLPLPQPLDAMAAVMEIDPSKDADGLTPTQQGRLNWNIPGIYPCTALAILKILNSLQVSLSGKIAAVVGQSVIVGAPTSTLLTQQGVTVIHLHEQSIASHLLTRQADILISATGVVHLIRKEWVKPGAIVIDVGIQKVGDRMMGDVDFEEVRTQASFITPVPGGVGPITVAVLLENCLEIYTKTLKLI
jgi:methylenetetrahydrofolate dehydrogenase (NADP+)/methenyltetrahydrofolate cyclohydrolase